MAEDNIIIICRHGERIDCSSERNNQKTMKGDPELTKTGINLSKYLGQRIYTEFKPYIEQNRIKLFVSPFTRTLETAISIRNEMQMNLTKANQDFYIIKNLGEVNFYNFDLYPNILYYNTNTNHQIYQDLIIDKMNQGNIDYNIIDIDNGNVKYKETRSDADERYENELKKILEELKGKKSYLYIIVQHGEGVAACCRYLCNIIKQNSIQENNNKLYPNFLNMITGDNQNYCNSFCFKINTAGDKISYYDELCYKPEINIDSEIVIYENYYKAKLIKWLKNPNNKIKNENKNIKEIKLIYRGTRDGFQAKKFHEKCDNKGETLTLIESQDNYIFGGYTEINWDSTVWNGNIGENNNARRNGKGNEFVFTLKNPHEIKPAKFNMKKSWLNHSICCDVNLGPIFGCNDIRIENNCNITNNRFTYYDFQKGEYCFEDTTGHKRLLFTGKPSFLVQEIEVFQVIR